MYINPINSLEDEACGVLMNVIGKSRFNALFRIKEFETFKITTTLNE
jgi:hypothetical protein